MEPEPCAKKAKLDKEFVKSQDSTEQEVVPPEYSIDGSEKMTCDEKDLRRVEDKYGLRLFIYKGKRFSGIIKQRYADFIVRECDEEGNLVYLTNLDQVDDAFKVEKTIGACPIEDKSQLQEIEIFSQSDDKTKTMTLNPDNDKEHRKLVHKYIKDVYKQIETDTVDLSDGAKAIKLSFKGNNTQGYKRKPDWVKKVPKFCHFVLYQEGRGTMECINKIAKFVHTKASNFAYAGTKDRRACSVQRVSVKYIHSKQLSGLNLKLKNMAVGNFSYKDVALSLGALSGNEFMLMIRHITESDEVLHTCCTSLKDHGFINYFGLQRFGTGEVSTHSIGKALLKSNISEALELILQCGNDDRFEAAAKKIWQETKDAKAAFKLVKHRTSIEGKILEQLSRQSEAPYNYYNAFMALPRNNRTMYLHSYQSLIWNNMTSKRIEEYGLEPVKGDLVLSKDKDEHGHFLPCVLSEDDISSKTYTIYDVVLPLPGYDMIYPSNSIGQCYKDTLSSDGIDIANMRNKIKDLSLSGTYRNILVKPKAMSWQIIKYNDYTIPLVQTDLEKIRGITEHGLDLQDGKFKGLCLQMTLPTSSYATTALREVLLSDSSYESQLKLNQDFEANEREAKSETEMAEKL